MKDITAEVRKNAILYVWDSAYQVREDDTIKLVETLKEFKSFANRILEDYAHIIDTTGMSKREVKSIIKRYQRTYYVTQLNNLCSIRNPDHWAYDDLYFSEQTPVFMSKELDSPHFLLNIKLYGDELETATLVHAGVVSSDCENLHDIISEKLGIDSYKDPHPLMMDIWNLSKGYKLHLYTLSNDMRYFIKDIAVIQKFYKEVPELQIVSHF